MAQDTTHAPSAGGTIAAWLIGGLLLVALAVVVPLLAPLSAILLIAGGISLRRRDGTARTVGTVLLAAGVLLAVACVVVAVFGLSVESGGS